MAIGGLAGLAKHLRAAPAPEVRFFRIGTAVTSGTYFPIGGEIASAISNPPGSRDCERGGSCGVPGVIAVAQATQGSVDNVIAVASGRIESALCQADVASWAFSGTGTFEKKPSLSSIRAMANLFPESVHVIVRQDSTISSLKELKGKRVSLGEPESGTLVDARLILSAVGLTEKDVKSTNFKVSAAAAALQSGAIDAFFMLGGYPVPAIADLAAALPIRLLPLDAGALDKLKKRAPFFSQSVIPGGTYHGLDEEVPTLSVGALWIVSTALDDDLAYSLLKALWHDNSRRLFEAGHPIGRRIQLAHALDGVGIPLHPGAARFYADVGMTVEALRN
jgi:TRAP transporter TAXI family solute receptor